MVKITTLNKSIGKIIPTFKLAVYCFIVNNQGLPFKSELENYQA